MPPIHLAGPVTRPDRRRRNDRRRRTLCVASAAGLLAAGLGTALAGAGTSAAAAAGFPAHYAAPYLQVENGDVGDMAADQKASGDKYYTLAFLTPTSGCSMEWEDGGEAVGAFSSQISSLQAAGGNVIISFGGESGGEVAQTCTSVTSLTAAYAKVVSTYGVTRLDFDIEGDTLGDSAANNRRNLALAALQKQNPAVQVDYTLAVDPDGLPSQELGVLQNASANGVKVSLVNIMTMDFGNGQNALKDALSAAQGTAPQLANLYNISTSQAYGMMGLTPIAGQNDDNEFFSQSDASTLESFASTNGVQELSFWEVDQFDKPAGFAYSKIFNAITGGSTGGGGGSGGGGGGGGGGTTAAAGPVVGFGGQCLDVRSASTADFTPVQVFTCNGTGAQKWTLTSAGTLQALGKCLDIKAAGKTNGTTVDLFTCNGTGAQVWQAHAGNALFNPASGKCLDDTNWSTTPGTQLQIWSCTGAANQSWTLPSS